MRVKKSKVPKGHQKLAEFRRQLDCQEVVRGDFGWFECNTEADKAVLIIHGVTGGKLDMMPLAREYVSLGWTVYCLDLPGHGKSKMPPIEKFDDLADWLKQALATIGRQFDLIISNSYASAIVYRALARGIIPETTEVFLGCPTPTTSKISNIMQKAVDHLPNRPAWHVYNTSPARAVRIKIALMTKNAEALAWLKESEALKKHYTTIENTSILSTLLYADNPFTAPLPDQAQKNLTIIMGTKDNVVPKNAIQTMKKLAPKAKMVAIDGVGHILHFEAWRSMIKQ